MVAGWSWEWAPSCRSVLHGEPFSIYSWSPCSPHRMDESYFPALNKSAGKREWRPSLEWCAGGHSAVLLSGLVFARAKMKPSALPSTRNIVNGEVSQQLLFELYSDKTPTKLRGWIKSVTGWCELVLSWQYLEGSLMENTLQQKLPRCPVCVWPFGTSLHSSPRTACRYPRARLAVWRRGGKTHVWSLGSGKK